MIIYIYIYILSLSLSIYIYMYMHIHIAMMLLSVVLPCCGMLQRATACVRSVHATRETPSFVMIIIITNFTTVTVAVTVSIPCRLPHIVFVLHIFHTESRAPEDRGPHHPEPALRLADGLGEHLLPCDCPLPLP